MMNHSTTNEEHIAMRQEIEKSYEILKKNGISEDVANFMRKMSLEVCGGLKNGDKIGPEATTDENTLNDGTREFHESYGAISLSRITGSRNLFGSSIEHRTFMEIRINRACMDRSLHSNRHYEEDQIVSVYLSPEQFAQLISSAGIGGGVPCTIHSLFRQPMAESHTVSERKRNTHEFHEYCKNINKKAADLVSEVKELFDSKAAIGKKDREAIVNKIENIMMYINENLPFIQAQYTEAIDKTEAEAKHAVEAFMNQIITVNGLAELKNQLSGNMADNSPKMIE